MIETGRNPVEDGQPAASRILATWSERRPGVLWRLEVRAYHYASPDAVSSEYRLGELVLGGSLGEGTLTLALAETPGWMTIA